MLSFSFPKGTLFEVPLTKGIAHFGVVLAHPYSDLDII